MPAFEMQKIEPRPVTARNRAAEFTHAFLRMMPFTRRAIRLRRAGLLGVPVEDLEQEAWITFAKVVRAYSDQRLSAYFRVPLQELTDYQRESSWVRAYQIAWPRDLAMFVEKAQRKRRGADCVVRGNSYQPTIRTRCPTRRSLDDDTHSWPLLRGAAAVKEWVQRTGMPAHQMPSCYSQIDLDTMIDFKYAPDVVRRVCKDIATGAALSSSRRAHKSCRRFADGTRETSLQRNARLLDVPLKIAADVAYSLKEVIA